MFHPAKSVWLILSIVLFTAVGTAAETAEVPAVGISDWLVLGPLESTLPAFDERSSGDILAGVMDSLTFPPGGGLPADGEVFDGFSGPVAWRVVAAEKDGHLVFERPEWAGDRRAAVVRLASSVKTRRFVSATIEVESGHLWKLEIDGRSLDADDLELDLEPGDHVVELTTVFDPEAEGPWTVSVALTPDVEDAVTFDLRTERELAILDVLDATTVTAFDLAPRGERAVFTLSRVRPATDTRETWIELRSIEDGSLLASWRGAPAMTEVRFAPTGNRLSYVTRGEDEETATLWIRDLSSGETTEIAADVEGWDGYLWSPDGEAIVFGSTKKPEENKSGIKRMRGLLDRMAGHRDLTTLHLVDVGSGERKKLTGGSHSTAAAAFSPDGSKLLVTREIEDLSRRPYSRNELWELDLQKGDARKLRDFWWLGGLEYAPDGKRLLVQAGPSEFGPDGIAVSGDGPVNDFDGQLFIWDPESGEVDPITLSFDPSVTDASWSRHDGTITLLAIDGHRRSLFSFDPAAGSFIPIATGIESVASFDVAPDGPTVLAAGTSVWQPQKVVVASRSAHPERLLLEPASERFESIRRGEVRQWNFTASDGREVVGRVYYPTTYSESATYPAIVNYYGGTSPMDRSFGGRYPAEWWAANGYVVYVLTPTGAYGWGQEQSTVHVNDWGEVTSRQIIEASTAFLEAHPFVDPARVGCIGASYGGFMTMKLVTETDLFAAAVAHAGISALSSYWGEGYWGYSYGAVANAESFPWNRKDIFVDRSPLFKANEVSTPLLLTHGDEDPNVPPGESDQFYAALKLLGIEAEYLRIAGLGHLIMEHDKRALWSKSILAWFDRLLKDQPQWWTTLYPEE